MTEPSIALVFTPDPWVEELHRYLVDHGGARIRQLLIDPTLAIEERYEVLVVGHRWPALTRALVADLHARRRAVLGVYDRDEPAGRAHLESVGADWILESDAAPHEFLAAITGLRFGGAEEAGPTSVAEIEEPPGRSVVVAGPAGGGATEVAIGLAAALATRGDAVVLVDADEMAGSLAPRLALPVEPNLRAAVDAVEFGAGTLEAAVTAHAAGFRVLAGLPSTPAWLQVRPGEVLRVLGALAGADRRVVVDAAGCLEDVGNGSRTRYAVTRALVAAARVLVAVTAANPVGVTRLLSWLVDARRLAPDTPVHVVANRAPRDPFRRGELVDELAGACAPAGVWFVPADPRVEAAAWAGTVVRRGPFTRAVGELAAALDAGASA